MLMNRWKCAFLEAGSFEEKKDLPLQWECLPFLLWGSISVRRRERPGLISSIWKQVVGWSQCFHLKIDTIYCDFTTLITCTNSFIIVSCEILVWMPAHITTVWLGHINLVKSWFLNHKVSSMEVWVAICWIVTVICLFDPRLFIQKSYFELTPASFFPFVFFTRRHFFNFIFYISSLLIIILLFPPPFS